MVAMKDILKPGNRVRIVRQMPRREQCWTPSIEGTIVSYQQASTGAWFAHSKNHKLWLDRAIVRMEDGELTDCVLDVYTRIDSLENAAPIAKRIADSFTESAGPSGTGTWRLAPAYVGSLALGAFVLAAVLMPARQIAIGAMSFFFLALWMSLPVLIAAITDAGPLHNRSSSVPFLPPRAAHRSARRFSTRHKPSLKYTRIHAMNGHSAVISTRDFDRLNDLIRSPESRFYGPMTGLETGLTRGSVVAPCKVGRDVVTMNSKVEVRDIKSGERETYTLVYPADADIDEGKLSVLAPLGAAILGARVRQEVVVHTPRGERRLRIERILYQPEAAGHDHL